MRSAETEQAIVAEAKKERAIAGSAITRQVAAAQVEPPMPCSVNTVGSSACARAEDDGRRCLKVPT